MQRKDLALGARFGLPLGHQRRLLRLPEVAIWEIFEFPGGLVIYNSYQVQPTTCLKSFFSFVYTYGRILALGPRFGQVLGHQRRLLWFPEVAIWEIFEFLGGLSIYNSYQCEFNYLLEIIYLSLGTYKERI